MTTESLVDLDSQETGLHFERMFTTPGVSPFDEVEWIEVDAVIKGADGEVFFEQKGVRAPACWSQTAVNVVASKYFYGRLGTPERETSVQQLIERVTKTITGWAHEQGYFDGEASRQAFEDELSYLILHQKCWFNSPVQFNVGAVENPAVSACFIQGVEDSMESILQLNRNEGMLFKGGSGTGSNLSALRSSKEHLAGGGLASGPVSFMRGFDSFAGVIKSGGRTRRAAKMVILNDNHPDILEFITCKAEEERKAHALIDSGYDGGFNVPGGAYDSVQFQNANHSVRVSDAFMEAVRDDQDWELRAVTTGEVVEVVKARDIWAQIAEAAWFCGDPGVQFDGAIQGMHTLPNVAPIKGSNPCSEYLSIDDSACNLASLNLLTFLDEDGDLQTGAFQHAVEVFITAMDAIVNPASYPTPKIGKNARKYRQLGLGYANLGAALMSKGLAYDSDEGRQWAAAVTSLMCATAYRRSTELARLHGAFADFEENEAATLGVLRQHQSATLLIGEEADDVALLKNVALHQWAQALNNAQTHGVRNSQATVLAPTGTIGMAMDCDTTGIEPAIALISYKTFVGGGSVQLVNQTVTRALTTLGYDATERKAITDHLTTEGTIEGAPGLKAKHYPVFDCAFAPPGGDRVIAPMGHVRMMAAAQPFLSGAISKTVNVPTTYTAEEIADTYMKSWELGLKAVAVYRDGCKRTQPLSTSLASQVDSVEEELLVEQTFTRRVRLPDERPAITHKFEIGGYEGYLTVGLYENGQPGELFIVMNKEGSVVSGLLDVFATSISLCLQYGVPLEVLVNKFTHTRFEPSGWTPNPDIGQAKSIADYVFRWLELKFLSPDKDVCRTPDESTSTGPPLVNFNSGTSKTNGHAKPLSTRVAPPAFKPQSDAPPCSACGSIMYRSGSCYKCGNCGNSSGCS